jgi:alkanesulfonate monooxygenase SsuD/methylene tetrahydromethanopterin reductase-like flavin-dependent oxidoreductase (luciferase family)
MSRTLQVATTPWSWDALGPADQLCAQAEQAEAMGFHSFWLPENHFGQRRAIPSPLILLAAVAARTTRMRLGCTSYLLPIRHPLLAAEEVAVLDQLSRGRLILGLGRGIQGDMFRAFGISSSEKRKLFRENLETMCRAWRGEPVAEGEDGAPVRLAPLPLQRPHPPLWVAAFGPLALKQVASLGLPYLASPIESLKVLEENYRQFRGLVEEAGHSPVGTVPVMRTVFVTGERSQARQVAASLSRAVPPAMRDKASALEDWAIVGDGQYARDKLAEYVERLGLTHLILRGGISGVGEADQQRSHERILDVAGAL